MTHAFEEIKTRMRLPDVISTYGFTLDRAGNIVCPFHREKTGSMRIYEDHFHCFGCGAHGTVIDFVARMDNLKPIDAARKLSDMYGLNLFPNRPPTAAERKRAAEDAQRREADKTLVDGLTTWWVKAWATVDWYGAYLSDELGRVRPTDISEDIPQDFWDILRERDIAEYMLECMASKEKQAQISFFKHYREKVKIIEQFRDGGRLTHRIA